MIKILFSVVFLKNSHFHFSSPEPLVWLVLIKLVTKHSWVKMIKVCSNEGPPLSARGDNKDSEKNIQLLLRSSSPELISNFTQSNFG